MAKTINQTRKRSRVPEYRESIHAKGTTFDLDGKSVGIVSNDEDFLAECWNAIAEHFEQFSSCNIERFTDVVLFPQKNVETEEGGIE